MTPSRSGAGLSDRPLLGSGHEFQMSCVCAANRDLHAAILAEVDRGIERLREAGYRPTAVLTVVDREEGGRAAIEATGLRFLALATFKEMGAADFARKRDLAAASFLRQGVTFTVWAWAERVVASKRAAA